MARALRTTPILLPSILQFETTNYCNVKCIYCNVQNFFDLPRGRMSYETLDTMLTAFAKDCLLGQIREVRPFLNGDPLTDYDRLPYIIGKTKVYFREARIVTLSNGADFSKADLFLNPDIDEAHFTISAATRDTYLKIHGVDRFEDAVKTVQACIARRHAVYVHFVYNKLNYHELREWRRIFKGAIQQVSPLHYTEKQGASLAILDKKLNDEAEKRGDVCTPDMLPANLACNTFNNQAVGWRGEWLNCCDNVYEDNHGTVYDTTPSEAFARRIRAALSSPYCAGCNLKNPNHVAILKKANTEIAGYDKGVS